MTKSVRSPFTLFVLGGALGLVIVAPCRTWAQSGFSTADPQHMMRLEGCGVAIIIADGHHEHEFWFPYYRFKEERAEIIVAGPKKGTVYGEGRHGKDGLPANVTHTVSEIAEEQFDMVYLPGGLWSPIRLRAHRPTLDLVRKALRENVLVAAICHAPQFSCRLTWCGGGRLPAPPTWLTT